MTIQLSPAPSTKVPRHATLLRRDLFDARFQILNQDERPPDELRDDKGKGKGDTFVDEHTDLVKGVYEGGLKTWECSLDLVDLLDQRGFSPDGSLETERVRGKSMLEVRSVSRSPPLLRARADVECTHAGRLRHRRPVVLALCAPPERDPPLTDR